MRNDLPRQALLDALHAIPADLPYDDWVSVGFAAFEAGLGYEDWVRWSRSASVRNPPTDADLRSKWGSFRRHAKGEGDAALRGIARRHGWREPEASDARPARRAQAARAAGNGGWSADEDARAAESREAMRKLLAAAAPAEQTHPYIARKGIPHKGLYVLSSGSVQTILGRLPRQGAATLEGDILIAPLRDAGSDAVVAIEMIDGAGRKAGLPGLPKAGTYWCDAPLPPSPPRIGIAEGIATALSARLFLAVATPGEPVAPVLSASGASNLRALAETMRRRHPLAEIVLFADLGNGEAQAREAAEAVAGVCIPPPAAAMPQGGTDWNDLDPAGEAGEAGVAAIRQALDPFAVELFVDGPLPPLEFVLPGLRPGTVGLLAGPGGAGKTFLAMQLAFGLALGRDTLSLPPEQAEEMFHQPGRPEGMRIGLVMGEDDALVLQHRAKAIAEALGLGADDLRRLGRQVSTHVLVGEDMRVVQSSGLHRYESGPFLARLAALARRHDMLIIDPLIRIHDAQENDNSAASRLMTALNAMARTYGCSLLLLHHMGKAGESSRGASAFTTSVRWEWHLAALRPEEAGDYGLPSGEAARYVRLAANKANYVGSRDGTGMLLERDPRGVLRASRRQRGSNPLPDATATARNVPARRRENPDRLSVGSAFEPDWDV